MIIWVNIVLKRTVVDSNCRFNNVCIVIYRVMHRLLKCQSLSTTVLFRATFTQTIILNLLMKKEKYSTKKIERQCNKEKEINKRYNLKSIFCLLTLLVSFQYFFLQQSADTGEYEAWMTSMTEETRLTRMTGETGMTRMTGDIEMTRKTGMSRVTGMT